MIEDKIKILLKEFNKVRKLGYVKSINYGNTSVNKTFESLIADNKELVDYVNNNSINIKVKRSFSKAYITLFDMVPDGGGDELLRLARDYGIGRLRSIKVDLNTTKYVKVNGYYYYILRIDYENRKIYLEIYDYYKNLIEDRVFWDFDELEKRLLKKLSILALVKAWPDKIGGVEYFNYYKMYIYFLREFSYFIEALADGIIRIIIKISYNGERLLSHRVSFVIKEEDLNKIFELYC